jgi:hypothetical protein
MALSMGPAQLLLASQRLACLLVTSTGLACADGAWDNPSADSSAITTPWTPGFIVLETQTDSASDTLPEIRRESVAPAILRAADSLLRTPPRSVDTDPQCTRFFGHADQAILVVASAVCEGDTFPMHGTFYYGFVPNGAQIRQVGDDNSIRIYETVEFNHPSLRGRPALMCPEVRDPTGRDLVPWSRECSTGGTRISTSPQNYPLQLSGAMSKVFIAVRLL